MFLFPEIYFVWTFVTWRWWLTQQYFDDLKNIFFQVLEAFARAEKRLKPNWKEIFTEVYDEMPVDLKKQMDEMEKHVNLYKDQYPLKNYAK